MVESVPVSFFSLARGASRIALMSMSARSALRRSVRVACNVMCDRGMFSLTATDLSTHGVFLACDEPIFDLRDEVILSFQPPGFRFGRPMTCMARVTRVQMNRRMRDNGVRGIGLTFTELDYDELMALEETLRVLPPPLTPKSTLRRQEPRWREARTEKLVDDFSSVTFVEDLDDETLGFTALSPVMTSEPDLH